MVFTPVLLRCTTPLSLQPLWFGPRQWTIERGEGRYILLLYYLHTENISKYFVFLFSVRKFLPFIFLDPPLLSLLTMPASLTRGLAISCSTKGTRWPIAARGGTVGEPGVNRIVEN